MSVLRNQYGNHHQDRRSGLQRLGSTLASMFEKLSGGGRHSGGRRSRRAAVCLQCSSEAMEPRVVLSADPLPVLMVIADTRDFYYQEYGDTRTSLEADGLTVQVAATTLNPSTPHSGTGEGADGGIVTPDLTLSEVDAAEYSAIVFVGGWGSSMYQYAFEGDYADDAYDGDLTTKTVVNNLISDFIDLDRQVAAICHGVTVLAWARVDGVSPLAGKTVSIPYIGSPAVYYQDSWYGNFELGQYEQVVANGAIANTVSGQYGNPATAADDVWIDGRIITAENYESAATFGHVIAAEVLDAHSQQPSNQPPLASDSVFLLLENSVAGTVVGSVVAADPDAGQVLTWTISSGNTGGTFAIHPLTGQISVANAAGADFETNPVFHLVVTVTDNGQPVLSDAASVTIQLQDVEERLPAGVHVQGDDLILQGTSGNDVIYVWSGRDAATVMVWMNGVSFPARNVPQSGHVIVHGAEGNDQIFATDTRRPVWLFGEAGHDLMTGGRAADVLDGGDGVDRIQGSGGSDLVFGGSDDDILIGSSASDILVGGPGNDFLEGLGGSDLLIGGQGSDYLRGGTGEDLLIGGMTSYDSDTALLREIQNLWLSTGPVSQRAATLTNGPSGRVRLVSGQTVRDDGSPDVVCGGEGIDLFFAGLGDNLFSERDDLFVWL